MSGYLKVLWLLTGFTLLLGCNTLYNTRTVHFEILVPGKVIMPQGYRNAAIRYNNCNVAVNPFFSYYLENENKISDPVNTDSIASVVYFQSFTQHLKNQQYFDSIFEIEPFDYSNTRLSDLRLRLKFKSDDSTNIGYLTETKPEIQNFTNMVRSFSYSDLERPFTKFIDPDFGLYSKEELKQIADSTGADLLFSFDWFGSLDGIYSPQYFYSNELHIAKEIVKTIVCWNIYDLNRLEINCSYRKIDSVSWIEPAYNLRESRKVLPPRNEAVYEAADIAGKEFAEILVPHWVEVERVYYKSGYGDLKKAGEMVNQDQWLEAARLWKKNTTNTNKYIAAKSMFNMALACEMSGQMDAALDWVIKSFKIVENKNEFHSQNCKDYIRILSIRKTDIKNIERRFDLHDN